MINQLIKPFVHLIPENNRFERIWLIAKTDFLKRYYGSALGLIWALIMPLARLVIYFFIFTVVFKSKTENFILFLFLGLVLWLFFVEATKDAITIFRKKRFLLENIEINKLDIYYASLISNFFAFVFNFSIFLIVAVFYGISFNFEILFFPILVINLMTFILGFQFLLSILYIQIRDIKHLYDIVVLFLFWLSGILFELDPESSLLMKALNYFTPIIGIITNARAIIIYGESINYTLFIYDWIYSIVFLLITYLLFKKYSKTALEYL